MFTSANGLELLEKHSFFLLLSTFCDSVQEKQEEKEQEPIRGG